VVLIIPVKFGWNCTSSFWEVFWWIDRRWRSDLYITIKRQ
jgi:hypothetical protein